MQITLKPFWKQHLAYERLHDHTTEFIVYGGAAGGGKSWLGCEWLLRLCLSYPGVTAFVGRSELKQLRKSTLPTMQKVCRFHGLKPENCFRYNGQDNSLVFKNGSRIDLIELKHYPSDVYYERFGSLEYTVGWIEEAGEIDKDAASMISSRTGRQFNDKYNLTGKVLITCNPKKNWLYYDYYIPYREKKLADNKSFIQANVEDNKYGESGYKKKLDNLKGIALQRLRYGVWEYDSDITALIDSEALLHVYRHVPFNKESLRRITVDVARYGDDSSVIGIWEDFHVKLWRFHGLSTSQLAQKVRRFAEEYGHSEVGVDGKLMKDPIPVHRIIVDADGVGGGVVDQLDSRQFINGSSARPAPVNPAIDDLTGEPIPEQYKNLKSQCHFRTAEKINNGIITIEIMPTELGTEDEERTRCIEDMEQVKVKNLDSDGKKEVMGKKEIRAAIGRSTDYWDTIAMHELFILEPEQQIWIA